VSKTGPSPPHQAARHRHPGALRAPGRGDPIDRVEDRGTMPRPPGRFDAPMAEATGALTAEVAPPHRRSRGIRAGCQPGGAAQRPLMGQAAHLPQGSGQGACHHRADAWGTPLDGCALRLGCGWVPPPPAHLEQLARGTAPLVGPQRETRVARCRQRPRGHLPSVPATHHAPTRRGDEATLVELGCARAGNGGAGRDALSAGPREETRACLGGCGDREATAAPIRQVDGQFLGVTTSRFAPIVGRHRAGRGRDDEGRHPRGGEGAGHHAACKPGLIGRRQRGSWQPPQPTVGEPRRGRRAGRRLPKLALTPAGHRRGSLRHIDPNRDTCAGRRAAWLCPGACLARLTDEAP
jgi:hypothetical protein